MYILQNHRLARQACSRFHLFLVTLAVAFAILVSGAQAQKPAFGNFVDMGLVVNNQINEASGLVASRKNPGVLWTHNDSGDQSRIFALTIHGTDLGIYGVNGVPARDWEDIALGPGPIPGESYLFIGDIGDNKAKHEYVYIYRIAEPKVDTTRAAVDTTLSGAETIILRYPNGSRDAEALMVDPLNGDIYVVSKRDSQVIIYRVPFPQATNTIIVPEIVDTLDITQIVAGDISPTGQEILLKNYTQVYYWHREPGQTLQQAFAQPARILPYEPEPQGESICWAADASGYFTVSEEVAGIPAHLYFYPRLDSTRTGMQGNCQQPNLFDLGQNFPNPFHSDTRIHFQMAHAGAIDISIYNSLGQKVRQLLCEKRTAGTHWVQWDGRDDRGFALVGEVYYCQMRSGAQSRSSKLLLMR